MTKIREKPRQRPRSAILWIFLGNAVLLACVMLWYGIVETTQTEGQSQYHMNLASNKGQMPRLSPELFGIGAKAETQNLPFRRPVERWDSYQEMEEPGVPEGKDDESEVQSNIDPLITNHERLTTTARMRRAKNKGPGSKSTTRALSKSVLSSNAASHACSDYDGVLHIKSGDRGAASGAMFFQYVINQLIYADMFKLMPFIHLDNTSHNIYDEDVHGVGEGMNMTIPCELEVSLEHNDTEPGRYWPGKPHSTEHPMVAKKLWFRGTGVWNHYLEPVSAYDPSNEICQTLPYITLAYEHLTPSIQFFAPWAVRSWEYQYLSPSLRHDSALASGLRDWYAPQRLRAHKIVTKYYRFRPHMWDAARQLIPDGTRCLAVHIRHADKGGLARKRMLVPDFLPFVTAYIQNGGDKVYLATDSSKVVERVEREWEQSNLIVQGGIVRSANFKPVFRQGAHNRTNTEVLIDILAMSRCQYIVHGFSSVSEATHYLNPSLHNRSVDVEDPGHMNATEFGELVTLERSSVQS